MPVPFTCPNCGNFSNVSEEFVGQSGPCAKCGVTITVPIPDGKGPSGRSATAPPQARSPSAGSAVILLGVVGALLLVMMFIGAAFYWVLSVQISHQEAILVTPTDQLKQIGLALHNYHDVNKCFPAASTRDAEGKALYSWRVAVLPYLEQAPMYESFDRNESWDSPRNRLLALSPLSAFSSVDDPMTPQTSFVALVGPGLAFEEDGSTNVVNFTDGTSNTILVVEVANSGIQWSEPRDLTLDEFLTRAASGTLGPNSGGVHVLMADGSVKFLPRSTAQEVLKALATRNGGETVILP